MQGKSGPVDFSMGSIEILRSSVALEVFEWDQIIQFRDCGGSPMKSEYPASQAVPYPAEELKAPSSRLLDEKISDDSGTEAKIDNALKPAGLKNPFWK
jgi:hypothetical protein